MQATQATLPYLYTYATDPAADEQVPVSSRSTISLLAVFVGLLLSTVQPQEAGVVPATEIVPLNDTQSDLALVDVVEHLEARLPAPHRRHAYKLGSLVMELSERHQLSPALILAVIDMESSFRADVVSNAGAIGLMQLRPSTAAEVAARYHVRGYKNGDSLRDPATNLRLGVAYLAQLRRQFGHSIHYLAAYNLGPTALKKRIRAGRYELGSLDFYVRTIHARARTLQQGHQGGKLHGLKRVEALMAAN